MQKELLEKLESNISQLLDEVELLRMEVTELKEEKAQLANNNASLEEVQNESNDRLKALLSRFSQDESQA